MQEPRYVSLFRNGRNQALRIPRDWEIAGNKVIVYKDGEKLIIEPIKQKKLLEVLAELETLNEDFPDTDQGLPPLDDINL